MKLGITAFFGDAEYSFELTDPMIAELERAADQGIGAIYFRAVKMQFHLADLVEIIRLGLIGGGVKPDKAAQLVQTYGYDRPIDELLPLALDILDARWSGKPANGEADA